MAYMEQCRAAAGGPGEAVPRVVSGEPGPDRAAEIAPGRYRHFKGGEYEVLAVARHSETGEAMVVYRALYGERGLWVRPAEMWNEVLTRDGRTFRRFERVEE